MVATIEIDFTKFSALAVEDDTGGMAIIAVMMRYLGMETLTAFLGGGTPGPGASIAKLYWSEYHKQITELAVDILGAAAMTPTGRRPSNSIQCDDPGAPDDSAGWVGTFYAARGGTIYAGTSEVQRNIIAEQLLGLPREPRP